MSKIGLIIKREYLQTVGKKSFLVTTLLVPILMIAVGVVLPAILSDVKDEEKKVVSVIDETEGLQFAPLFAETEEFTFIPEAKDASEVYATVIIPSDVAQTNSVQIVSEQTLPGSLQREVQDIVDSELSRQKVESYGIDSLQDILASCNVYSNIHTLKLKDNGEAQEDNAVAGQLVGLLLALVTYMFVLLYGAMIMNSVVEEKTNRIVEVIVSSCKPFELMLGKIIGVALVGFTQIVIWGAVLGSCMTALGIATAPDIAAQAEMVASDPSVMDNIAAMLAGINFLEIGGLFLLYFIGGYLLYASLFAAFGSAVDQASDASQFMSPIMMIMIFSIYVSTFCMENPDGPLCFWCSIIPFTSPIVMMIRIPYGIPTWEIALSLAALYAFAFAILWLAARIYRTGILMYGRKFGWKDILKWMK